MPATQTLKVSIVGLDIFKEVLNHLSTVITDRDKHKSLYNSSQETITVLLEELTQAKHELDSLKGIANV